MGLFKKIMRYSFAMLGAVFIGLGIGWVYDKVTSKPEIPISVGIRPSILSKGRVLILESKVNHNLFLDVSLENEARTDKKLFKINLEPNRSKEIGWAEGWQVHTGDFLTINSSGYRDWSASLKKSD